MLTLVENLKMIPLGTAVMDTLVDSRIVEARQLRLAWERQFGRKRGLRKQLADLHGVHESFIGALLNGDRSISTLWKVRMAQFLNQKPEEIWPDFDLQEALGELLPPHIADLVKNAWSAHPEDVHAANVFLQRSSAPRDSD